MDNVKIVFTDLDSTLTISEGKIDIANKKIFEKLANIGVPVVINTGRSIPYTIPFCKQFSTSHYLITSNGAEIYNYLNKKIIYRNILSKDSLKYIDKLIDKHNLLFMANGIEKRYSNKTDQNSATIFSNYLSDINDELAQVVIESYDVNTMIEIKKAILDYGILKIANKTKHIEEGKLLYYDIVNNDVSKGKAAEILCDYLKINPKKAMAIGDSTNDLEMLKSVGYKVAVSNATDDIKEIADIVTLSNKQNGVATILNELYNQKTK
jgi:Cof subfamily protein (haloacid dehalogenase superfamily)